MPFVLFSSRLSCEFDVKFGTKSWRRSGTSSESSSAPSSSSFPQRDRSRTPARSSATTQPRTKSSATAAQYIVLPHRVQDAAIKAYKEYTLLFVFFFCRLFLSKPQIFVLTLGNTAPFFVVSSSPVFFTTSPLPKEESHRWSVVVVVVVVAVVETSKERKKERKKDAVKKVRRERVVYFCIFLPLVSLGSLSVTRKIFFFSFLSLSLFSLSLSHTVTESLFKNTALFLVFLQSAFWYKSAAPKRECSARRKRRRTGRRHFFCLRWGGCFVCNARVSRRRRERRKRIRVIH